jgi:hypothetical protein
MVGFVFGSSVGFFPLVRVSQRTSLGGNTKACPTDRRQSVGRGVFVDVAFWIFLLGRFGRTVLHRPSAIRCGTADKPLASPFTIYKSKKGGEMFLLCYLAWSSPFAEAAFNRTLTENGNGIRPFLR